MFQQTHPLAERMRPVTLDDLVGQEHLVGAGGILRRTIKSGQVPSLILWGPPGVGKTTIANIIANEVKLPFSTLSAISAGVKDVREVIGRVRPGSKTVLFIDEIHRFNKSQQDALLGAVEKGKITLIGATTENPSFEVNAALLSRCQVYTLRHLSEDNLLMLLDKAMKEDEKMSKQEIELKESAALLNLSGGDARKLLNLFELVVDALSGSTLDGSTLDGSTLDGSTLGGSTLGGPTLGGPTLGGPTLGGPVVITDSAVQEIAQQKTVIYDKDGEMHYDIISAFIKSIRGSDPNAGLYYLARMIEGGEDVKFIARRLVILASE
ncbi:MAG: replication-associated recombination protein A, partial [Bacteroidota bacterium]